MELPAVAGRTPRTPDFVDTVAPDAISTLNITAATLLKAGVGRMVKVSVVVAGSAAGSVNDCATTGAAAAANAIAPIPNALGTYLIDWPYATGLVVVPGTGQTLTALWV